MRGAALLVACVIAAPTAVQEKPDFSGGWILEEPTDASATMPRELTVRQWTEPSVSPATGQSIPLDYISIERRFASEVKSVTCQIGLSGGMVSGISAYDPNKRFDVPRPQTRFSIRWNDRRLVIETGSYSGPSRDPGPYSERDEEWSLAASDKLVIAVRERSSTSAPVSVELIYRRRLLFLARVSTQVK